MKETDKSKAGIEMDCVKGRLAPTPSGEMHIGNAFCYLLAWLSARSRGGRVALRFEDADTLRMRPEAVEQTFSDLLWLGLDWDEGPSPGERSGEYFQSCRTEVYDGYFEILRSSGEVYPCFCTRRDLQLAAAPHAEDRSPVYPGTCRGLSPGRAAELSRLRPPAWRIKLSGERVSFTDLIAGEQSSDVLREHGDFPVRRADGVYCYQFTAALDDALMGVSEVVRSRDLLSSTPWQVYVQRRFSLPSPVYVHIPMLLDPEGARMAKRGGSLSLREIRRHYSPEEVLGRLGYLAGLQDVPEPCGLERLLGSFRWDGLPGDDIAVPRELFSRCARE